MRPSRSLVALGVGIASLALGSPAAADGVPIGLIDEQNGDGRCDEPGPEEQRYRSVFVSKHVVAYHQQSCDHDRWEAARAGVAARSAAFVSIPDDPTPIEPRLSASGSFEAEWSGVTAGPATYCETHGESRAGAGFETRDPSAPRVWAGDDRRIPLPCAGPPPPFPEVSP